MYCSFVLHEITRICNDFVLMCPFAKGMNGGCVGSIGDQKRKALSYFIWEDGEGMVLALFLGFVLGRRALI